MAGVCAPPVTQASFSVRACKICVLLLPYKLEKRQKTNWICIELCILNSLCKTESVFSSVLRQKSGKYKII